MLVTNHATQRMVVRHVDPRLAGLAMEFAKDTASYRKKLLRIEDIPTSVFNSLPSHVKKLAEKQLPLVVWIDGNVLITAARVNNKRINYVPSSKEKSLAHVKWHRATFYKKNME